MKNIYRIADFNILIEYKYNYTFKVLEEYLVEGNVTPDIEISVTEKELEVELEKSEIKILDVVENSCILRKLANLFIEKYSAVLFHASAIAYNGNAYLFTAPSGTGKSTHTGLLKELLGDKLTYINDDKPFIKLVDGKFYVYGSPWSGKHRLNSNVCVPLKAVIKLERSNTNSVNKLDTVSALTCLLEQAYRYDNEIGASNLLDFINKMLNSVVFYNLKCNKDISAAQVSFENILKD
ncbi:MAG: hypothetical protein J6Q58_06310 [Clostridia bacterium]|nr:hypothetical protein [Clostridia bacterium]